MLCSISGVVPEEPVFCAKSGHIYERRLVTKHIEQTGREPVTGEEVSVADLQPVRSNKVARPRPVGASSVGGMLALLQNEFDAMLLEAFQLRTELESTRQELSQALYQHDAACRVIARLVKERDNARSALAQSQSAMAARLAAMPQGAGDVEMGGAGSSAEGSSGAAAAAVAAGVTEATVSAIKDATKELSRARKKRAIPAETPAPEELARLGLAHAFSHHSSGSPGVASLDVLPSASQALLGSAGPAAPSGLPSLALSGGADGTALLLELPSAADASVSSGRVIGRLKGHGKRVTAAALVPGAGGAAAACVTGGADGSVRVWTPGTGGSDSWSPAGVVAAPFGGAREPVLSLSMHPTLPLACASSASGWALLDVSPGAPRGLYASGPVAPSGGGAFTVGLVHPDGAIYALGASDGSVRVFDLRSQAQAASFDVPDGSPVTCLAFSHNGWLLAAGSSDGSLRLWDLRKAAVAGALPPSGSPLTALAFDVSSHFLAAGHASGAVGVWGAKDLQGGDAAALVTLPNGGAPVTAVAWGPAARSLLVASDSKTALAVYTLPPA